LQSIQFLSLSLSLSLSLHATLLFASYYTILGVKSDVV
jgi:hypothetical protein